METAEHTDSAITTEDAPVRGTTESFDGDAQPSNEAAIERGEDMKGKSTQDLDAERPEKKLTPYVVLAGDSESVPGQTVWAEVTAVEAKNQPDAKRKAVLNNEAVAEMARKGGVSLVAVPAASWKPTVARIQVAEQLGVE